MIRQKICKYTFVVCAVAAMLTTALPVSAAEGYDQVGTATINDVGSIAMTPITGDMIPDGTYDISVDSSSSFFRIVGAQLTVKDGKMTAQMTMYSTSYSYVYPGTAEEAAAAPFEDYIAPVEVDYYDTFTIPVDALNSPVPCAAFSKRKKKWYSRNLVFDASTLPEGTLPYEFPDYDLINEALEAYEEEHPEKFKEEEESTEQTATESDEVEGMTIDMKDGSYSIECDLSGGSGRASVTSPTWFYVKDGQAYARLLWSSAYYDYMIVGGKRYLNETTDGSNSTFTIPVLVMDEPMEVVADTVAMGEPVEVNYSLTFYKDSIGSKSNVPQEGAKRVIIIAFILMIGGGILNHLVKRKKQ